MNVADVLQKDGSWHEERARGLGGSDANVIMNGSHEDLLQLWRLKTGQAEPEDLSHVLPVVMGTWTEPLNVYWYTQQTGQPVTASGASMQHADHPWMRATLDGMTMLPDGNPAVFEAKHVNAFAKIEEVTAKYMPQLHHTMMVTQAAHARLSVFLGTLKWELVDVELDVVYAAQLLEREQRFWECVELGIPPVEMPTIRPPVPIEERRTVDMGGNNAWADAAAAWLENKDAAGKFNAAVKGLKELVEEDVGHAFGHGVQVKRTKAGSLTISTEK